MVDELACVVTEPPAGVGVVEVLSIVVVVEGAALGVGAVVLVLVMVVVVECVGAVCATLKGMAKARLAASAPTASNAFMAISP